MHKDFEKNGYLVVRNFFDATTLGLLQDYFSIKYKLIKFYKIPKLKSGTSFVASGYDIYADTLTESISTRSLLKVSELLKINVHPTYTSTRIYEKGDHLAPHVDKPACEISITSPIITYKNSPSIIYISNYTFNSSKDKQIVTYEEVKNRGDYSEVKLYPGDVLFYKGCEMYHWREPLEDELLIQFFMHYIQVGGKYEEWYLNKRPFLGHQFL